jgi:hypothetical protein
VEGGEGGRRRGAAEPLSLHLTNKEYIITTPTLIIFIEIISSSNHISTLPNISILLLLKNTKGYAGIKLKENLQAKYGGKGNFRDQFHLLAGCSVLGGSGALLTLSTRSETM